MVSHADLVFAGHQWLRFSVRPRHYVVLSEIASAVHETPDVIGWATGFSTLVECKATRNDFAADRKKSFRRYPETGMGYHRWFLAPKGLLRSEEVPEKWGLAELSGSRILKTKKPAPFLERNWQNEMHLLSSAVRRLDTGQGLQVFVPNAEKPIVVQPGSVRLLAYMEAS